MSEKLLVFELDKENETLEIHLDQSGAKTLISYLEPLTEGTGRAHFHLKTPTCGGSELTEDLQAEQDKLIHHVQIVFWPD